MRYAARCCRHSPGPSVSHTTRVRAGAAGAAKSDPRVHNGKQCRDDHPTRERPPRELPHTDIERGELPTMSGPVIGGPGAALTLASRLAQADEELASASVSVSTEPHLDPVLASLIALVLGAAVQTTSCESGGGTGGGGAFELRSPPVPYWDGTADVARAAARLLARLVRCSQRSDRLCVANFAVRDGAGVRRICALAAALHGLGGPRAATPRACILCAIDSLTGPPPWCRRHANPGRRRLGPRCHCASQIGSRWLRHGRPGARERRCRCCAPHKCKHARATQRFGGMNALDAILKKRAVEERL
jgi:hypothetical protein